MSVAGSAYRKRQANAASSASRPLCLSTKLDLSEELRDISLSSNSTHETRRFFVAAVQKCTFPKSGFSNLTPSLFSVVRLSAKEQSTTLCVTNGVIFQKCRLFDSSVVSSLSSVYTHPAHLIDRLSRQSARIFCACVYGNSLRK